MPRSYGSAVVVRAAPEYPRILHTLQSGGSRGAGRVRKRPRGSASPTPAASSALRAPQRSPPAPARRYRRLAPVRPDALPSPAPRPEAAHLPGPSNWRAPGLLPMGRALCPYALACARSPLADRRAFPSRRERVSRQRPARRPPRSLPQRAGAQVLGASSAAETYARRASLPPDRAVHDLDPAERALDTAGRLQTGPRQRVRGREPRDRPASEW